MAHKFTGTVLELADQFLQFVIRTKQHNYFRSKHKDLTNFLVIIRDLLNEATSISYNENQYFGLFKGFRKFFHDGINKKDDVDLGEFTA